MSILWSWITATDPENRNQSLDSFCRTAATADLLEEVEDLERRRHSCGNLYQNVRALFFLYAIHRFHLPARVQGSALIPYEAQAALLNRRYEESIRQLRSAWAVNGPSDALCSALAAAYRGLGFQTLADQVRSSVRSVRGSQWMFRTGHVADYPLRLRSELLQSPDQAAFPVLHESTPVRMDLSHSGWSDIFFLGMDMPEAARVLNISVDLAVRDEQHSAPAPPVQCHFRVIDRPILRLVSIDLNATAEVTQIDEMFDFSRDYLGLLKAAVIASGLVPPGFESSGESMRSLLRKLLGADHLGLEIVSHVRGIPKGSRLAVSTTLLGCLIAACMRATGQIEQLTGSLQEAERRIIAARAILGEWLGGSGGGWQDSGGVWPGIKLIQGVSAQEGDPEFGVSRGALLPQHHIFTREEVGNNVRQALQDSLVLVHGGMAQDVGPLLEMVTERYLLRSEKEWVARREAGLLFDEMIDLLKAGDLQGLGAATQKNFEGPLQTMIPWAGNLYTDRLIHAVQQEYDSAFWGFWMLGGMSGGGMGFLFDPAAKPHAQDRLGEIMSGVKRDLSGGVPFAMEPVVYDFRINESGSTAELLSNDDARLPDGYYLIAIPALLKKESRSLSAGERHDLELFNAACHDSEGAANRLRQLVSRLLPREAPAENAEDSLENLLRQHGFDAVQHEQIRSAMKGGFISLARNRMPISTRIEDATPSANFEGQGQVSDDLRKVGEQALSCGSVAVVTLAGGAGSRWTHGAGVVKGLAPFCRLAHVHRTFLEVHLAKSRRTSRTYSAAVPHVITTTYLTANAILEALQTRNNYGYDGPLYISRGLSVGLRMIPMVRDLRFAWEETAQQVLDAQAEKVRTSLRESLIRWAEQQGQGTDYTSNTPQQCLHPMGHWYEIPNLLLNGTLSRMLTEQPALRHLMVHNVDTVGANLDPVLLGWHIRRGSAMTAEVIRRRIEDHGGGLARIDGKVRLVEGMALPYEESEFALSFYNSNTFWIDIDRLLGLFSLDRASLHNRDRVTSAVRDMASRMPSYLALKDVKRRWGNAQEDIFPVAQVERLWGDMTAIPELDCDYIAVPRSRGQQLKEPAQLDSWLRDGSAAHVASLCDFEIL